MKHIKAPAAIILVMALLAGCAARKSLPSNGTPVASSTPVARADGPEEAEKARQFAAELLPGFKVPKGYRGRIMARPGLMGGRLTSIIFRPDHPGETAPGETDLAYMRVELTPALLENTAQNFLKRTPVSLGRLKGYASTEDGERNVQFPYLDAEGRYVVIMISGSEQGFSMKPLREATEKIELNGFKPLKVSLPEPPKPTGKTLLKFPVAEVVFPVTGKWFWTLPPEQYAQPQGQWQLCEISNGRRIPQKHEYFGQPVLSGNGEVAALSTGSRVQFVQLPDTPLASLDYPGDRRWFDDLILSSQGHKALKSGMYRPDLIDTRTGKSTRVAVDGPWQFSSNENLLLGHQGTLKPPEQIVFASSGGILSCPPDSPWFAGSGQYANGTRTLRIFSLSDGKLVGSVDNQLRLIWARERLALTTADRAWTLWSVPAWQELLRVDGLDPVFSQDGKFAASTALDGESVEVRELPGGQVIGRTRRGQARYLESEGGQARLWVQISPIGRDGTTLQLVEFHR